MRQDLVSCRADDHSDMSRRNRPDVSPGRCLGRCDEVPFGSQMKRGHGKRVRHRLSFDHPSPGARQVQAEQILDELPRGWIGKGLPLVRPFLKLNETPGFSTPLFERAKLRELPDGALGVQRPECGLQYFHGKCAERLRARLGTPPHVRQRAARALGIAFEIPRCRKRDQSLRLDDIRRSNRHRTAKTIADKRGRTINAAQQRKQQHFDMFSDRERRPVGRFTPVEQESVSSKIRDCCSKRHLFVEVENAGRIDEGRHEHEWRSFSAMISEARAQDPRHLGFLLRAFTVRSALICAQAGERIRRKPGVGNRDLPYQFEKQWQGPRSAFMLQCTNFR